MINKNISKLLLSIILIITFKSTFALNVSSVSNFQNSCPGANVNSTVYFTGTSKIIHPADEFWTDKPAFIHNWGTDIDVWQWNGWTTSCLDWWYRASNFSPWNYQHVNAFYNNNCLLNRNTNPNLPFTQIVFRIGFKYEESFQSSVINNQYFFFNMGLSLINYISDQRTRNWGELKQHSNECLNIYARWCWDGIVSSANWETCDNWSLNWTAWNSCSSTCTNITIPVIPGSWLGTTTSWAWEWAVPADTTNNPNF